jgi:hypothetical protein
MTEQRLIPDDPLSFIKNCVWAGWFFRLDEKPIQDVGGS